MWSLCQNSSGSAESIGRNLQRDEEYQTSFNVFHQESGQILRNMSSRKYVKNFCKKLRINHVLAILVIVALIAKRNSSTLPLRMFNFRETFTSRFFVLFFFPYFSRYFCHLSFFSRWKIYYYINYVTLLCTILLYMLK